MQSHLSFRLRKLTMLAVLFLALTATLNAQWTQTNGLTGKTFFSIVKAGSLMFAGASTSILTSGDVYVSTDVGNNGSIVKQVLNFSGILALICNDYMV